VFEDTAPINNAPDGGEEGLGGFSITLEDAGGRYGISAGMQMQDAFGNPLGTVYQQNPDGSFVLDGDGNPVVAVDGMGHPVAEPLETGMSRPTCGMLTIETSRQEVRHQAVHVRKRLAQTSMIEGTR
jgi:hypothetical protein